MKICPVPSLKSHLSLWVYIYSVYHIVHCCSLMQNHEYETRQMQVVLVYSIYPTLQWLYLISLDSNSFFMLLGMIPRLIGWQLMVVWEDDRMGEEGWRSKTEGRGRREGGRVVGLRNLLKFNFKLYWKELELPTCNCFASFAPLTCNH